MSEKGDDYLKYLGQTLKKADGSEINFDDLDPESIDLLNDKFKGLKLTSDTTSLNADVFVAKRKESATSISEYLGFNGHSLSSEDASDFKLVDGNLVWEASAGGGTAPTKIFGTEIDTTNCEITKKGETTTKIKLTLDNLKKIFNPLPTMLV